MEREGLCLHKPCNCPAPEDGKYCCEACYSAEQSHPQGADCGCGHRDCQPELVDAGPLVTG